MSTTAHRRHESSAGKPAWKIAECFPPQGRWDETEYLILDSVLEGRRVELVDGFLEFLPVPKKLHEMILQFLYHALFEFVRDRRLGAVHFSGSKTKLRGGDIRLPDVFFLSNEIKDSGNDDYYMGANLVMEVVSKDPKDRKRDLVEKRQDYARTGVSEYWIVDPQLKKITVLALQGTKYDVHGEFKTGQKASSMLLKGFEVDVSEVLAGLKQ